MIALRDIIDDVLNQGPDRITHHGDQAVIVVFEAKWTRLTGVGQSFDCWPASRPRGRFHRTAHRNLSAARIQTLQPPAPDFPRGLARDTRFWHRRGISRNTSFS